MAATDAATIMRAAKGPNVRAGSGTSYAKVGVLEAGERVHVLERPSNWLRLESSAGQSDRFVYGPLLAATGRSDVAP